jgi:hypothetical protein
LKKAKMRPAKINITKHRPALGVLDT